MSKKQLIMNKALELFAKQGFEATSVQQITDYCGISKGAFYLSFKSKDELILALIDHFMQQMTVDIDYSVNNMETNGTLFHFFQTTFQAFQKHTDFVKLLMKEQTHTLNDELLAKIRHYDRITNQTLLSIIEREYGKEKDAIKYDLIFSIKGLINGYSSFLLFNKMEIDIEQLCRSLVEKTNLLANYTTSPFITKEYGEMFHKFGEEEISEEEVLKLIGTTIEELEDSIEKESLLLLKEHIQKPIYHSAIVIGLIENIRNHPQCKWVAYLLKVYLKTPSL